jgi:hypothetical protein
MQQLTGEYNFDATPKELNKERNTMLPWVTDYVQDDRVASLFTRCRSCGGVGLPGSHTCPSSAPSSATTMASITDE